MWGLNLSWETRGSFPEEVGLELRPEGYLHLMVKRSCEDLLVRAEKLV